MAGKGRQRAVSDVIGLRPGRRAAALAGPGPLARLAVRLRLAVAEALQREAAAIDLALVVPIFLSLGIIAYFAAPQEPGLLAPALCVGVGTVLAWILRGRFVLLAALVCLTAIPVGFSAAKLRTLAVAAPQLARPVSGLVTGVVLALEARDGGGARLVLRPASIAGLAPEALPARLRVTLRQLGVIEAGDAISFKALLRPPPPPAVPGGYDFARDAYFDGIGAVGFVVGKVSFAPDIPVTWQEAAAIRIDGWRNALTARIAEAVPGEDGAIAASQVTGKRGLIPKESNDALRASGLYHVVSISGLHMALFAGGLFWLIRAVLSLSRRAALTLPVKSLAAALSLAPAAAYTLFSGAEVATVRSFLMTAIVLLAVALRRTALTRRNVALSASFVLLTTPEQLLGPSFQMSFAAVTMLIVAHDWWQRHRGREAVGLFERSLRLIATLVVGAFVTTLVASLATAPFSAYHFHRVTLQSLVSNMLATPIVSFLMMPLALVALIAEPFGYGEPAWQAMGMSVDLFMRVARLVAAWPGSDLVIPQFSPLVLAGFIAAILILALLRSFLAAAALLPLVVASIGALSTVPPVALIGANGHAALVREGGTLTALAEKRDDFAVHEWLLAMGERRLPGDPSLTQARRCDGEGCSAGLGQGAVLMLDKTADAIDEDCGEVAVLVSPLKVPKRCAEKGLVIDRETILAAGSLALYADTPDADNGLPRWRLERAREKGTSRPWAVAPAPPAKPAESLGLDPATSPATLPAPDPDDGN